MRIQIDRQKRIILLKWLKNGVINTRDLEELNSQEDNLFLELIKSLPDVVWGINLTSLQMLFYDHTDSVCLTKEEWKAAHLKEGGAVINADDPANMKLIKSIFKD